MKLKIETNQELKYVMDFYNIPFVPIKEGNKDMGKITKGMKYEAGFWKYKKECEYMAFELAYKQVKNIIELKKQINKPFKTIHVYCRKEQTWMYPDVDGETPRHHVYPRTITHEEESELEGTMDEVFVKHYKANNSLRYCNGYSYHFKDEKVNEMYYLWLKLMPKSRSFNLYYGNGIVD